MQYLLIHAPYTYIVVLWHISNIPLLIVTYPYWLWRVKFVFIPPHFVQQQYLWNSAIQPAVGCYNSWANRWCLGCSQLGEISVWNGTITLSSLKVVTRTVFNTYCDDNSVHEMIFIFIMDSEWGSWIIVQCSAVWYGQFSLKYSQQDQGSFLVWAQPMRGGVTMQRLHSLAEPIPRMMRDDM